MLKKLTPRILLFALMLILSGQRVFLLIFGAIASGASLFLVRKYEFDLLIFLGTITYLLILHTKKEQIHVEK